MDLVKAKQMIAAYMEQHGLTALGWTFRFDRGKRRFGVCRWKRKEIALSKILVEINSEEQVRDTTLHEIAHALTPVGEKSHGKVWKDIAKRLGCKPNARTTFELPTHSYVGTCPCCGYIWRRYRLRRERSWHTKCFATSPRDEDCIKWEKI